MWPNRSDTQIEARLYKTNPYEEDMHVMTPGSQNISLIWQNIPYGLSWLESSALDEYEKNGWWFGIVCNQPE